MSTSVLPLFSSKSFIVYGFTVKSLIHFEFIFMYGIRTCSDFIILHVAVWFSQHHFLTVFTQLYILASFVKDKVPIDVWVYLWAFCLVPLVSISGFVLVPYFTEDCSFRVLSEVGKVDSCSSILLSQDCFGYSGSSVFPYEL